MQKATGLESRFVIVRNFVRDKLLYDDYKNGLLVPTPLATPTLLEPLPLKRDKLPGFPEPYEGSIGTSTIYVMIIKLSNGLSWSFKHRHIIL